MYIYTCVCVYVCVYTCLCVCVRIYVYIYNVCVYTHTCMYIHTCICVYCTYIYIHVYTCASVSLIPPPNSPRPPRFYFTTDVPAIITRTSNPTLCQQQSLLRADFGIATFLISSICRHSYLGALYRETGKWDSCPVGCVYFPDT